MLNFIKILPILWVISFSTTAFAGNIYPYFEANTISPNLLDTPSEEERKSEIKQIIEMQNKLTDDEIRQASIEYAITPNTILEAATPEITCKDYPALCHLLDRSQETALEAKNAIKDYWKISRPHEASKKIKLFTKASQNNTYPSGHATRGYTVAYILALLIPEKKSEFLFFVQKMSERRILVGEHFPSDIRAGRRLAFLVIGGLLQNADFQKDFRAAQKEIETHKKIDSNLS